MNNVFKEKVEKEFNQEKNYRMIFQKKERMIGMKKIGYVMAPVCAAVLLAVGVVGVNMNKKINEKEPAVNVADNIKNDENQMVASVTDSIKINAIQNYASAKLNVDSKVIEKEELPEELASLTKVNGLDASFIQTYYTKSDITRDEFDMLHDYVLLYFDETSNKTIKISCSNVGTPLRDYFFQALTEDVSLIDGVDYKISQYEDRFIINFEKENYHFDVETNGLNETEMIQLIKEIAK